MPTDKASAASHCEVSVVREGVRDCPNTECSAGASQLAPYDIVFVGYKTYTLIDVAFGIARLSDGVEVPQHQVLKKCTRCHRAHLPET